MSRGSAIVEALVVGVIVTLAISQVALAATRLLIAGEEAQDVAATAAEWGARHRDARQARSIARALAPAGASVAGSRNGDRISVAVRVPVAVKGPLGALVPASVIGRGSAFVAPYRSNR